MDIFALLWIVSLAFTGLTEGAGVLPDGPLNAAVGGKVMFTITLTPGTTFQSVTWKFGNEDIFTWNVNNFTEPEYEGRITFFMSTGSLELRNLALNDSGDYTVTISLLGEPSKSGTTRLNVYEPVSNVTVTSSSTELVEFNSSVSLSCSSSGSPLSFLWLNSSSEVTGSDRVQITNGGSTLTINNVTRYDQGPFRCRVFNPVSEGTSAPPLNLTIYYGPENTNLTISPPEKHHQEGSDIVLSCSADSNPPAQFTWFLNGSALSDGPEHKLMNVQINQSGSYSCQAFNDKTLRYETSMPASISVLTNVTNVVVTSEPTELVEFNSSVSLSCSSSGSSLSFLWLNSSSEVTGSDRVQITDGGSTLTINNVTRYDQGPFECRVSNPISEGTSAPLNLTIYYGPEKTNLTISQPQKYYENGSDISLMCSADSRPSAVFTWFLNGDLLSDTGSDLSLINVQISQSGNYSCQAFNDKTLRYEMSQPSVVSVLALVSNVVVTSELTELVEFNSSVSLSCSSSGSSLSFLWLNSSSEVTGSDRVQITDGNSTLTIINVTRYDQGPFSCQVFNPISNGTSDPLNLTIYYGPEKTHLTISQPQKYYENGSDISLMCSADSRPSAVFKWFLNGAQLSDTGSDLSLMNVQISQSGNYSCQAFNDKTLRYEMSQPSVVSVLEKVSGASVTSTSNLPIEGKSFRLICDAAGSVFTRKWRKGVLDLTLTVNMTLTNNNRELSFSSLNKDDTGDYSCNISNPLSSEEAKYPMIVNYGPETVQITGPSQIHVGGTFKLTCSAASVPTANYTWTLNGAVMHTSAVIYKNNTELSDSGNYYCKAMNDITRRNSSVVHELTVTLTKPGPQGLSGGGIAGIVIGVLVVLGVVAAIVWYFLCYKQKPGKNTAAGNPNPRTGDEGQDNGAYTRSQEMHYADVSFTKNNNGETVQMGDQNKPSDYAEVRVNNNPRAAASSLPTYDAHQQRNKRPAPQPEIADLYAQVRKN
ncbi:carcinoembryonic antigen-related cell adhesion molecule 5-like isoform X1 [Trematomus bernacchii]|uniref:carcinoembryonic antigen-related cell adhesion molecule 5-like isoform X1 n=1 Tax=Trematomus bernacchii TaxID=40690 RepID=UPI00146A978F|nr:carcinoembryonic antigen-related cell adhesion molecule 5-like isoform X1 [Trematomus bernacchii]